MVYRSRSPRRNTVPVYEDVVYEQPNVIRRTDLYDSQDEFYMG